MELFKGIIEKAIDDNPELKRLIDKIKNEIKGKNNIQKLKIYKKWQKELKQVADKQEHQTN
jgi:hypothetical protein